MIEIGYYVYKSLMDNCYYKQVTKTYVILYNVKNKLLLIYTEHSYISIDVEDAIAYYGCRVNFPVSYEVTIRSITS